MDKKRRIEVIVSKTYSFPESVLSPEQPFIDAKERAKEMLLTEMEEGKNHNEGFGINNFDIDIMKVLPVSLKNVKPFVPNIKDRSKVELRPLANEPIPRQPDGNMIVGKIGIKTVVQAITNYIIESNFGKLDVETNPKIFITEKSKFGNDMEIYLRDDIEKQYVNTKRQIERLLQQYQ